MAEMNNGLFGAYKGKIGNIVFYQRNGKNVVRTIGKSSVPPSIAQLRARKEMSVATVFVQSILAFVNIGFRTEATKAQRYPFNMAVAYNKTNALKGSYPDIEMDYSKARVSEGDLLIAQQPTVVRVPEGLQFSWFTDPLILQQFDLDKVLLMAYFPRQKELVYIVPGRIRADGQALLRVPEERQSDVAETYISFITADQTATANSVYTGSIVFST